MWERRCVRAPELLCLLQRHGNTSVPSIHHTINWQCFLAPHVRARGCTNAAVMVKHPASLGLLRDLQHNASLYVLQTSLVSISLLNRTKNEIIRCFIFSLSILFWFWWFYCELHIMGNIPMCFCKHDLSEWPPRERTGHITLGHAERAAPRPRGQHVNRITECQHMSKKESLKGQGLSCSG